MRFLNSLACALLVTAAPTALATPLFSKQVLYSWTGESESSGLSPADHVAIIDYDHNSATYGQILTKASLPDDSKNNIRATGNEPHHSAVSSDGHYFITGGLLSFLNGVNEIFIFQINTADPTQGLNFVRGVNAPGACTDAFVPIGGSHFLVSMMCSDSADSPGNLIRLDASTGLFTSAILSDYSDFRSPSVLSGFNPHGYAVYSTGEILSADYIQPISLLGAQLSDIVFRDTVRLFDNTGTLSHTFDIPISNVGSAGVGQGNGFMDVHDIPGDSKKRAYTMSNNDNLIYLITPGIVAGTTPTVDAVFDTAIHVTNGARGPSAGIWQFTADGTRALIAYQLRFILLFDISTPETPILLQSFDFCNDASTANLLVPNYGASGTISINDFCKANNMWAGSHYIAMVDPTLTSDSRFVVWNYFLKFGLAPFPGTRTVHSFIMADDHNSFSLDTAWPVNQYTGLDMASPHSGAFIPLHEDGSQLLPLTSTGSGDPQFAGFQGQNFQVHGEPDSWFHVLSTPNMFMNALFSYHNKARGSACDSHVTTCYTHPGTYMSSLAINVYGYEITLIAGDYKDGMIVKMHDTELKVSSRVMTIPMNNKQINGTCSHSALNTWLTQHPINTTQQHDTCMIQYTSNTKFQITCESMILTITNSQYFFNIGVQLTSMQQAKIGATRYVVPSSLHSHSHADQHETMDMQLLKQQIKHYNYQQFRVHGLIGQTYMNIEYPHKQLYQGHVMDYLVSSPFTCDARYCTYGC